MSGVGTVGSMGPVGLSRIVGDAHAVLDDGRGLENDGTFGRAGDRSDRLFERRAGLGAGDHATRRVVGRGVVAVVAGMGVTLAGEGCGRRRRDRWATRGSGRRRPCDRRLRYSPRLGAKAWIGCYRGGRLSARRLAERGARDELCERRAGSPDKPGAELAPQAVRLPADVRRHDGARLEKRG
jgi:hypothetical protein